MYPVIYNIFPRFHNNFDSLVEAIWRASHLNCNWVYLNPIHPYGKSGSLYSVLDLSRLNTVLFPNEWEDLERLVNIANKLHVEVMVDLVFNHSATDSPLIQTNPDYYQWNNGSIIYPGCKEDNHWISWNDLAQFNFNSYNLQTYLKDIIVKFCNCGVTGFRCDAAYQIPSWLWKGIIDTAKGENKYSIFVAETLGCSIEQTVDLAKNGFDFVMNSSCWSSGNEYWLQEQTNTFKQHGIKTIGFPESHDTNRRTIISQISGKNVEWEQYDALQRSIACSNGLLIVEGYELFLTKKCPVVADTWYKPYMDEDCNIESYKLPDDNMIKFNNWLRSTIKQLINR